VYHGAGRAAGKRCLARMGIALSHEGLTRAWESTHSSPGAAFSQCPPPQGQCVANIISGIHRPRPLAPVAPSRAVPCALNECQLPPYCQSVD
jgi:hypothetical protein